MSEKQFMISDDTECPIMEREFELNREEVIDLLNKQDEYINLLREELELADKQNTELEEENAYLNEELDYYYGRSIITIRKRFMVDDAGSLIDIQTRKCYDYVSEVVDLLNEFSCKNEELKKENEELKKENAELRKMRWKND